MRPRHFTAAVLAVSALVLTACGSDEPPAAQSTPILPTETAPPAAEPVATETKTPGVYAPTDTAVGRSGLEASILSVEDVESRYGPVTVLTIQIVNTTNELWEGYNWSTPALVYGAAGMPAEHVVSLSEGFGDGVQGAVPPGSRQTVKHAYKVTKAELNPAVVSASSAVWQGDFATFQR